MYKTTYGLSPAYLTDLISKHVPSRSLRARDADLFYVPLRFLNMVIAGLVHVNLFSGILCLNT